MHGQPHRIFTSSCFVAVLEARILFSISVYRGACLINLRTTDVIVSTYGIKNGSVVRADCVYCGSLLLLLTGGENMM